MPIIIPNVKPPTKEEYAYYLKEYDELDEAGQVLNRYQELAVVRDDKLVAFPRVMGKTEDFPLAQPLFIFAAFEHTCDELMDIANALREDSRLDELLAEREGTSTLMRDYLDSYEMRKSINRSHARTLRNLKEQTNG